MKFEFLCFFSSPISPSVLPPVHPLRDLARSNPVQSQIVGVAGVESNFLALMTPCVSSYSHPDLPAIMVFMEYLKALEVSSGGRGWGDTGNNDNFDSDSIGPDVAEDSRDGAIVQLSTVVQSRQGSALLPAVQVSPAGAGL